MPSTPLAGSERSALRGARPIRKANPDERFEVTLILRRAAPDQFAASVAAASAGEASRRAGHADFEAKFGAKSDDLATVKTFATRHGLIVVHESAARRTVILSGTVAEFSKAFGVDLNVFEHDNGTYRGRTGPVYLPHELQGVVEAVLGLDDRPAAKPHFRLRQTNGKVTDRAAATSYTPAQVAALYGFPDGAGNDQCVALIELGGGYKPKDLQAYFSKLGVATPAVSAVSVDHATNRPTGDPSGPDGEVLLDIEVAGAIAPQARIVVYFAPNTDAGFLNAITTAIHDTVNKPSVISISWGGPEASWTPQALTAFDQAFQAAATLGITVCVASGDGGSADGVGDGKDHVDFPASSPYALACGGSSLHGAAAHISGEVVWNDGAAGGATGGGISSFFPVPAWQAGLSAKRGKTHVPLDFRGVPDACGDADPRTGYEILVDGNSAVYGGTSAVAPLWAGLIARINAIKGAPAGYLNPILYKAPEALRDIKKGNNGGFAAAPGWDACTGLGSPNGAAVASLLTNGKHAG